MNVLKISLQNLKSKPLYTFLSVFILALSIALLLGVQQLKSSFKHQMDNNLGGIDLVIGAKGSPLQLILASVLHLDNPTGNIPYKEAKKIGENRLVKSAVPISYGDNYKGFRIVGTTPKFLSLYNSELQKGRLTKKSMEVVLGSSVALATNLKIGDTFKSSHGLVDNDIDVHDDELTIVGILKPSQKVIDRLIVTNLETVWDAHNHDHEESEHKEKDTHKKTEKHHHNDKEHKTTKENNTKEHSTHFHNGIEHSHTEEHSKDHHHENEEHKEVKNHNHHYYENKEITSLLLTFKSPMALLTIPRSINNDTNLQASIPKYELNRLYQFTGVGFKTISLIGYLILIISGLTIFISLYKMVKERSFDLALLRTYGASNSQLVKMVSYEGIIIAILAFILGFLLAKTGVYYMFKFSETSYQQSILQQIAMQDALEIFGLVIGMVVLAISLAIYPIVKMNISTILSNEK